MTLWVCEILGEQVLRLFQEIIKNFSRNHGANLKEHPAFVVT